MVRRPPMDYESSPAGRCLWCRRKAGTPRRRWHDSCVAAFFLCRGSSSYSIALTPCADCGGSAAEIDHRDPIWAARLSGDRRRILRAFLSSNLRWLCRGCHARKTAREAGERARSRRREQAHNAPLPLFGPAPPN